MFSTFHCVLEKKHATPTGSASSVRPHKITATAGQASQPSYSKTRTTDEIPSDGISTAKPIVQPLTNKNIPLLAIVFGVLTGVAVMIAVTVVIMLRWRSSRRQWKRTTESHVER